MSEITSDLPPTATELACDLLVLGASFTGIELLHQLKRRGVLGTIKTIVVDARPVHGYIPLVHEIVAKDVDPAAYVLPTSRYVRSLPAVTFVVDTVVGLDAKKCAAKLSSGRVVRARVVVVALGSTLVVPAHVANAAMVFTAKFLDQTEALRQRLKSCAPGKLVVIGGGITGVEMAGELAAWCRRAANGCEVILLEGQPQLLSNSGTGASRQATALLRQLGVEVIVGVKVTSIGEHSVTFAPNHLPHEPAVTSVIECELVIWAGGVRPSSDRIDLGVRRDANGWIEVDTTLCCRDARGESLPSVFAGGDAVRVRDKDGQWPTMQRAIECIWQGKVLARNVEATLSKGDEGRAGWGAPKLVHHRLIRDFPYGISIGPHSLVMYGRFVVNLRVLGAAFRRWLMRRYFARYEPL